MQNMLAPVFNANHDIVYVIFIGDTGALVPDSLQSSLPLIRCYIILELVHVIPPASWPIRIAPKNYA